MDVVVRGRNVEVPEHYRQLVTEKLARIERFDGKLIRVDVELHHEPNRRQSDACQQVEITAVSRGPVVRSEACAGDFYAALDLAVSKLERRMSKAADRRRVHHGRHRPTPVADAAGRIDAVSAEVFQQGPARTALLDGVKGGSPAATDRVDDHFDGRPVDEQADDGATADGPGHIVRRKHHSAELMSSDQALHNMELVGHDFYLFADVETGLPSVVYRRKGFAYGVIALTVVSAGSDAGDGVAQPNG